MSDMILLRPEEAARRLNLSRSKVYAMLKSGELPCVRIGRSVRVPHDGLKHWIDGRGKTETTMVDSDVPIEDLLTAHGLADVRKGTTAMQIAPALVRFAAALRDVNPLIRHVAREELLHRLTQAKVRTPAKMLALAFGEDER